MGRVRERELQSELMMKQFGTTMNTNVHVYTCT